MFPEILPAASSHKEKISCWLLQLQRLWTEMKKNLENQQRGYWERTRERCRERENREVKDTVGDREWDWGQKLKEKTRRKEEEEGKCKRGKDTGRKMLQVLYLLRLLRFCSSSVFSSLLSFASHFSPVLVLLLLCMCFCSAFLFPLPLFSSTSNNPQLFIWSCFGTTASSHRHTHAVTYWVKEL